MEEGSDPGVPAMSPNGAAASAPPPPPSKKDRHIVTWTPEEDDLLREQIALHGTETSWTNIASKFKGKTGRQCRRRWSTYLSSECKKGGWSAEEDMLLCEAQKVLGNRWTEITKVVAGRTDNAVKNRFSTLCKKRAKIEASSDDFFVNSANKRLVVQIGRSKTLAGESELDKQIRFHNSDNKENIERPLGKDGEDDSRRPSAVFAQNCNTASTSLANTRKSSSDVSENYSQATYLKRDDPKELQDILVRREEYQSPEKDASRINFLVDDIKDLIEGLKRNNVEEQQPLRKLDSHNHTQENSQHNTGSSCDMKSQSIFADKSESSLQERDTTICVFSDDATSLGENICPGTTLIPSGTPEVDKENLCTAALEEFCSPIQTVLPFNSFADGVPSPAFTASERQFLQDVLDLSSPSPSPHLSKVPSCVNHFPYHSKTSVYGNSV